MLLYKSCVMAEVVIGCQKGNGMFGLFRKKPRPNDATIMQLEGTITSLLALQLLILPNPQIEE